MICDWLPNIIEYASFNGEYQKFFDETYRKLIDDFYKEHVFLDKRPVHLLPDEADDGRLKIYWHIGGDDGNSLNKELDTRRIEKIPWIKAIIENYMAPEVRVWRVDAKGGTRLCLWLTSEDYIVVLKERRLKLLLITAYTPLTKGHEIELEEQYRKYKIDKPIY